METQIKTASSYIETVYLDGYRCEIIDSDKLKMDGFKLFSHRYIEGFDACRYKYEHSDGRVFLYVRTTDSQGNGSIYIEQSN